MKEYLKFDTNLDDSLFPITMAINGCGGDDVDSVKQLGGKRISECVKEVVKIGGGIEQIYSNVVADRSLFQTELDKNMNKYLIKIISEESTSKIISRNLKLVSFEVLSRFFDSPNSTEMLDKKNKLLQTLNNNDVIDKQILKESLEKSRVLFDYDDFDNLFYGI
jgi:hypothetical protein